MYLSRIVFLVNIKRNGTHPKYPDSVQFIHLFIYVRLLQPALASNEGFRGIYWTSFMNLEPTS